MTCIASCEATSCIRKSLIKRRATRRTLKSKVGEMPYEDRLKTLNLLPLTYDREIRDLVLVYKLCIFGYTDLNIEHLICIIYTS